MTIITRFAVFGWIVSLGLSAAHAQDNAWAIKMFEKTTHDFGVVARASDVKYRFKITNLYKPEVHIASVRTTCGCTAATPTTNTLASRGVAYIEVTMDTRKFTRQKDSNLIVTFDQPLYAEVRLPISAYIRTDVVLDPGGVNFGAVERGQKAEKRIAISYAGRDDWKIKDIKVGNSNVEARFSETGRTAGRVSYDLIVSLKPTAPVGALLERIVLITDDEKSLHVPVLVQGRVEADITVTPSLVSLGTISPGSVVRKNIVLRGRKPFLIKTVESKSDDENFKVRLPEAAKPVHVLPLTFTAPEKEGDFTEEFTVTIEGRPEPVTFKAYGRVSEK
jgi:hypothetical protein